MGLWIQDGSQRRQDIFTLDVQPLSQVRFLLCKYLYEFSIIIVHILHSVFRLWKRAMFCPECNVCFGREKNPKMREYYYCWVCSRQHHAACVGQERFICAACQNKTLSKRVGVMGGMSSASGMHHLSTHQQSGYQETPRPRLGRPRTNINYANFAWSSFVCVFALLLLGKFLCWLSQARESQFHKRFSSTCNYWRIWKYQ